MGHQKISIYIFRQGTKYYKKYIVSSSTDLRSNFSVKIPYSVFFVFNRFPCLFISELNNDATALFLSLMFVCQSFSLYNLSELDWFTRLLATNSAVRDLLARGLLVIVHLQKDSRDTMLLVSSLYVRANTIAKYLSSIRHVSITLVRRIVLKPHVKGARLFCLTFKVNQRLYKL